MRKRILSCILAFLLLIGQPAGVLAGESAPSSVLQDAEESSSGLFTYSSFIGDGFQAQFYYEDAYFQNPSTEYSDSLSTMSMCLALSAFADGSNADYEQKSDNLRSLLEQCGFDMESFAVNEWFLKKPETDSIGAGAACKRIKDEKGEDCWLIACAVRGLGYEREWAGNFTLGTEGEHSGFESAALQVISFLREYVQERPQISGNVKLWITGYSRGAATANLAAAMIDDGALLNDRFSLGTDSLYAYCFECPQGTLMELNSDNSRYRNIFSVVNQDDPVARVAPTNPLYQFGFTRYGVSKYLPSLIDDEEQAFQEKYQKMLTYYDRLEGTEDYPLGQFQMKKISALGALSGSVIRDDTDSIWSQAFFLEKLITEFSMMIGDRELYTASYQENLRQICNMVFSDNQAGEVMERFAARLKKHAAKIAECLLSRLVLGEDPLSDLLETDLLESLRDCGINDFSEGDFHGSLKDLSKLILQFGASHPNHVVTLACNAKEIASAHYPEQCFAWLMSFDPHYGEENRTGFSNGYYRVIRFNGFKDLNVQSAEDGRAIQSIIFTDDNGELTLILPTEDARKVTVTAEGKGNGNCTIEEHSYSYGLIRILQYNEISLQKNSVCILDVPQMNCPQAGKHPEPENEDPYILTDGNGKELDPDLVLSGKDALKDFFRISVYSENPECGWVDGGGIGTVARYVQVHAHPFEGCRFIGWYEQDELYSEDPVCRFPATGDITLAARFAPDE